MGAAPPPPRHVPLNPWFSFVSVFSVFQCSPSIHLITHLVYSEYSPSIALVLP